MESKIDDPIKVENKMVFSRSWVEGRGTENLVKGYITTVKRENFKRLLYSKVTTVNDNV